jgi:hypothetical protein
MLRHSGPRAELNNLTGIAAILSYPLDIEQVEEEEKQAREAAQAQVDSDANQDEGWLAHCFCRSFPKAARSLSSAPNVSACRRLLEIQAGSILTDVGRE